MDLINGAELDLYRTGAIHTPRIPRSVYTKNKESLFESIEDKNREQIADFQRRRANTSLQRRLSNFQATAGFSSTAVGGDVFAAIPRFYSPLEYFEQTQIPYDINNKKHRFELYKWLDLFYRTHFLIPILVDIFTRFPLVGIEFHSQDDDLNDFYQDLFLNRLNYEQFLVDMGREIWTLGQAFPMGYFNETMGIWETEELIDPTLVEVKRFPIIGGEEFFIVPPKELVDLVKNKRPMPQYMLLEKNYPELIPFLVNGRNIPISAVLMKQVGFKVSPRDLYGTPILLRGLRTLMTEEKLAASMDAIAERLYSPLILVKLGVQEMGPQRQPWIPGPTEISSFRNDLDLALSSDFRLIVHHFGIDIQNVFGREQMPRLDNDFDRIERRLMQIFGMNPNLLSGGNASTPYATSALQAELLNQILRTYQNQLKRHYASRAAIVAEAQGHYAYEKRGDTRVPIYEEVLEYDEEGNSRIVKKKKLMFPELRMKVLDLRDEATQRNFLQAIKQQGVPIADQELAMGMNYNFKESLSKVEEELIAKTVAQQEAKLKAYDILIANGYPIPPDLLAEMQNAGVAPPAPGGGGGPGGMPPGGPGGPGGGGEGGPGGGGIQMPPAPGGPGNAAEGYNPQRGTTPEQSNERRNIPNNPSQGPGAAGAPTGPSLGPQRSNVERNKKETNVNLPRSNKNIKIEKLTKTMEQLDEDYPIEEEDVDNS